MARRMKSSTPLIGHYRIPIRDEIDKMFFL